MAKSQDSSFLPPPRILTCGNFTLIALAILTVLLPASVYAQTLTHSYTFEDLAEGSLSTGTPVTNFATGEQDATLYLAGTGSATNDGGVLLFNGTDKNNGAYIQLPSDIIGSKTAITLETWVTPNDFLKYSRAWDIGDSDNATRFFNALTDNTSANSYTRFQNVSSYPAAYKLTADKEYLLTVTAEQVSETSTKLTYYVNGSMIGTTTGELLLSEVNGNENFLGRSHWSGDFYADAYFKEFNVYDGAMRPTQVNAQKIMGATSDHNAYDRETTLANAAQTDELIASATGFWNFNGNNNAPDLSGSGHNLSITGAVSSEADSNLSEILTSNGFYLHDQLTTNAYAFLANDDLCNLGKDSFTLATRVKMDSFKEGEDSYDDLIRAGGQTTQGTHYSLAFTNNGKCLLFGYDNSKGVYQKYFLNSLDDNISEPTAYQFEADKWYDIFATFEKGEDADTPSFVTLYAYDSLSGEKLASTVYEVDGDTLFYNSSANRNHFLLFEIPNNGHGNSNGYMDYAGVWGYALTENQLQSLLTSATSVPEPSTWALLALGVVVLFLRKRVRS